MWYPESGYDQFQFCVFSRNSNLPTEDDDYVPDDYSRGIHESFQVKYMEAKKHKKNIAQYREPALQLDDFRTQIEDAFKAADESWETEIKRQQLSS